MPNQIVVSNKVQKKEIRKKKGTRDLLLAMLFFLLTAGMCWVLLPIEELQSRIVHIALFPLVGTVVQFVLFILGGAYIQLLRRFSQEQINSPTKKRAEFSGDVFSIIATFLAAIYFAKLVGIENITSLIIGTSWLLVASSYLIPKHVFSALYHLVLFKQDRYYANRE